MRYAHASPSSKSLPLGLVIFPCLYSKRYYLFWTPSFPCGFLFNGCVRTCGGTLYYPAQYLLGREKQQPHSEEMTCSLLSSLRFQTSKAQIPSSGIIRKRSGSWPLAEETASLQVIKDVPGLPRTVPVVSTSLRFYVLKKHFHRITLSQITSLKVTDLILFYLLCICCVLRWKSQTELLYQDST